MQKIRSIIAIIAIAMLGSAAANDKAAIKAYTNNDMPALKALAKKGDATAQQFLGAFYATGTRGFPKDMQEAVRWYRKAAEQGDLVSQSELGWKYNYGEGVTQDKREAAKWWRMAAEQGGAHVAREQYFIGNMYYEGEGVFQDYKEAYIWLSLAVLNGDKGWPDEDAKEKRDKAMRELTADELRAAKEEAKRRLNHSKRN